MPFATGAGLKAALAARSFKKEVILLCTTDSHLDFTLQPIRSLEKLGLGNVMMLGTEEE